MSLHLMPAWRIGTYGCAVSSWGSWASGPTSAVMRWRWRRRMKRSDVVVLVSRYMHMHMHMHMRMHMYRYMWHVSFVKYM